jgi:PAS domain S-box-containing protein
MDGYKVARALRAEPVLAGVPIVAVTSYAMVGDREKALDLGCTSYLEKPINPDTFVAEVHCHPRPPGGESEEAVMLKEYSETLVRKLEEKVAELEQANRVLRESEARFRAIFESELECVKLLAADGSLLAMNPAGLRMLEADSFEQVERQCMYPLVVEEHRAAFRELTERVMRGESNTLEFQIVGLKGGRRWLETHASPLTDATGRIVAVLGIARDITEHKQAEAALRESEERFRLLVDHAPEAVVLLDVETGRFVHSNPAAETLFKLSAIELARVGPVELSPPVQPDGQPSETKARALIAAALAGEKPIFEWTHRDATGRDISCEVRLLRMELGGRTIVRGSVLDISERKAAEARIRQLSRTYAVLSDINQTIVREKDPQALLTSACRIAVEKGGFCLAWIGLAGADRWLRVTAHAGATPETIEVVRAFVEGPQPDCAFTYHALQQGERAVCLDIARDERARNWRDAALARGCRAMASLPLRVGNRTVGTFNLYASVAGFFDQEELRLLDELAADIGFALEAHERERERQRAEQALRELICTVDGIVWEADSDTFQFTFVSPHAERLLGYPVERWLNEPDFWASHLHPDDREWAVNFCVAATRAGKDHQFEYRMLAADGRVVWLRDLVTVVVEDGRPVRLRGIMVDVTEAKETEAALRASEERFREIAKTIEEVFWVTDPEKNRMLYVSSAYERIWGRSTQSLYASPRDWLEAIHPDDRPRVLEAATTRQTTGEYDVEYRIVRPDGQVRWIRDMAFPVWDESGRVVRIVGVARDITDQRLAQEQLRRREECFRLLIENAPDMIHVVDNQGLLRFQSPSAEQILGYTQEERLGRSVFDLVHPDDLAAARAALGQAVAQPGQSVRVECRLRHKNGQWRLLQVVGRSLPEQADEGFIVLNSRDVTDQRRLEEQFRQSQKMEAIGQLAGGVAHDFNNVLTAIIMQSELLDMDEQLSPKTKDGLRQIRAATERAANLTRQLLLFSRRQVMQPRDVDLNEVVTNLARMLQRIIGEDVRLQLHLNPMPLWTHADPSMLDQVLMNLAVNARDAMPEGGQLRIETLTRTVDEMLARQHGDILPGDYVGLRVTDTGCGIAPEHLACIFEPFFTTKEPGKGTGLGLATVLGIIKQHGGWIEVESQVGRGTTFEGYLPALSRPAAAEAAARAVARPPGGTETILLVEDDETVRLMTRAVLERHGYQVIEAPDGLAVLECWEQHRTKVALLLTDMVMPRGISGRELARRLQADRTDLKVLYMTGYSAELAGRELIPQPGQNFLQKPFQADVLLAAVRRCLDA